MAAKHLQRKAFNRSSLVSGDVEFFARKLIYFVLLQLVLSSFVLITADTLNGSQNNNNNNNKLTPLQYSSSQFGCVASTITDGRKCTGDDGGSVLKTELTFNETHGETTKENLILWHSDGGGANTERPFLDGDSNLSLTGNASIRNQSKKTITSTTSSNGSQSMKHRHRRQPSTDGRFNKDGERILSRKRRYLIFPPGSSLQIGKLYLHFFFHLFR